MSPLIITVCILSRFLVPQLGLRLGQNLTHVGSVQFFKGGQGQWVITWMMAGPHSLGGEAPLARVPHLLHSTGPRLQTPIRTMVLHIIDESCLGRSCPSPVVCKWVSEFREHLDPPLKPTQCGQIHVNTSNVKIHANTMQMKHANTSLSTGWNLTAPCPP